MKIISSIFIFVFVMISGCLFDKSMRKINDDGFSWGYVNSVKFLNVYYNDQGVFSNEAVVGICNLDSILVMKTVDYTVMDKSYGKQNIDSLAKYYTLNIDGYKSDPSQTQSAALSGPYSLESLKSEAVNSSALAFKEW